MYGIRETRIAVTGRPEVFECDQCEDTGFVETLTGLRECPLCSEGADDFLSLGASV
jgi:Zn finger protein HypA/HybF involved in hydrogenase expression